jgi:methionyl-tRNA formyltransferase
MKIIFFGATTMGYKCCRLILESPLAEVASIFTIPKEFNISYSNTPVTNVNYADFKSLGKEFGVPVVEITGKISDYTNKVAEYSPDFLLIAGWYHMIPAAMRALAPKGCAGFHASLLPKYRGGAPLVWSIINGESETGVSFFYLEDRVDSGDIIAQRKFAIEETDTIRELINKTTDASLQMVKEYLPMIAAGTAPRIRQDESIATTVPQRKPEDGLIDWTWDIKRIKNFIRAQTKPYPGAYTIIEGKKITIWNAEIAELN